MELLQENPVFIGFKMDGTLRRTLQSLTGSDSRYVSQDDPGFLMICKSGKDEYIGKLIEERLTTDRVEDVRRNILSILRRICPDMRFPEIMEIIPTESFHLPVDGT